MKLPDIAEFHRWQHPNELRDLTRMTSAEIGSNEDFLSRGGEYEKTVQEALVAFTFALGFHELISPIQIRMTERYTQLQDFELKSDKGAYCEFEIVTAYEPDRKIRLDYRDGGRPTLPADWASGISADPEWIAPQILKKTEKLRTKS